MRSEIAEEYVLGYDRAQVDVDALWAFLSREVYRGRWRTRFDVEHQVATTRRGSALDDWTSR